MSLLACAPAHQASAQKQNSVNNPEHKKIIQAFGGVYEDFEVGSYVAGLSLKIAKSSDDPESKYRVTVLDSPQVNAFAMPGGYTYVTRGLLALANNEAEVAAVMGHEIAHVTAAHGTERQRTSIGAAILASVLGNVMNSRVANQIIDIGATGLMAGYSRKQEYEADDLGVRSLYRAGYDPYAGGDFLAAMGRLSEREARLSGVVVYRAGYQPIQIQVTGCQGRIKLLMDSFLIPVGNEIMDAQRIWRLLTACSMATRPTRALFAVKILCIRYCGFAFLFRKILS